MQQRIRRLRAAPGGGEGWGKGRRCTPIVTDAEEYQEPLVRQGGLPCLKLAAKGVEDASR